MAAQKKNNEVERSFAGMLVELILCAFCMLIGFLMLFVDSMKIEYFAYVIGGVLLAIGIYLILNFFVRHGYREITNYDFSGGVLVTAIGVVVLINAKSFDLSFYIIIGVILLIISVMILQSTIQLKGMRGKAWWLNLIFAILILVYSILLLTEIKTSFLKNETLYYSLVIASGALGIFSIIITSVRSVYFKKEEEERAAKREDRADYSVPEISDTNKGYRQEDIEADYEEISVPKTEKKPKKKFSFEKSKKNTKENNTVKANTNDEYPEFQQDYSENKEKPAFSNQDMSQDNVGDNSSLFKETDANNIAASATEKNDISSDNIKSSSGNSDFSSDNIKSPLGNADFSPDNIINSSDNADSLSDNSIEAADFSASDSGFDDDELALLRKNHN